MKAINTFLCFLFFLVPVSVVAQDFWKEVLTGSFNPPTLKVSSAGNVYTVSDSFLISSSDSGLSWQTKYQFSIAPITTFGVSPTGVIYICTDSIWKSYDEGLTWIPATNPYFVPFLWFIEANDEGDIFTETGILIGSYSYRSEDEGTSWIKIGVEQAFLFSIAFSQQGLTYAVYEGNLPPGTKELFVSTNKGDIWTEVATAPQHLNKIFCFSSNILFASSQLNTVLYRSTDDGNTWSVVLNENVTDLACYDQIIFAAAEGSGMFWSTDWGETWVQENSGLPMLAVSKINLDSTGYLYIMTGPSANSQTKIYRSLYPATTIVGADNPATASSFLLYQNYPNPFNPNTTIRYYLPHREMITIKIFDLLGKELMVLNEEVKEAGEHRLDLDVESLSSGVYFYTLTAGHFSQTRKMILIR